MSTAWTAAQAWQDGRWHPGARLGVEEGRFVAREGPAPPQPLAGLAVPGMVNLHSHAFQRAMAGLAERRAPGAGGEDSFWTWRELMYAFAGRIGPDALQAIAAQLYVEMLKAGYTQVCEFHYLHHQPDGRPYADPAEMSLALVAAAREAGIGLTLLPVLYMAGGFDGRPLHERQRRFGHTVDDFLGLVQRLQGLASPMLNIGIALHSLRAVPPAALAEVLAANEVRALPVHVHIAEQMAEVEECLAVRGARPVAWLLDHADLDHRWCLVHATHMDDSEVTRAAASGAVAGICTTTEGNLGDGFFRLADWLQAGGALGVGSDSHVSISPVEELRWLEYGQRLLARRRLVAADAEHLSVGERLFQAALDGGSQAAAMPVSRIAPGARADLVVLDADSVQFAGRGPESWIDSWLFSGNENLVRDVMVAGEWQVRDGQHRDGERIAERWRETMQGLVGALA